MGHRISILALFILFSFNECQLSIPTHSPSTTTISGDTNQNLNSTTSATTISSTTGTTTIESSTTTGTTITIDTTTETTTTRVRSYSDFAEIEFFHEILTQLDSEEQPIEEYIVYLYTLTCAPCTQISEEVLEALEKLVNCGMAVFVVNVQTLIQNDDGDRDQFLASIDVPALQVPMLIIIKDGVYQSKFIGATQVIEGLGLMVQCEE